MSEEQFWEIIGRTTRFQADTARQIEALHSELEKLPIEEIESYEAVFDQVMKRSYAWDLWAPTLSCTEEPRTTRSNIFAVG